MISIRKSAEELDRIEELIRAIQGAYTHAVASTGQYAVEIDSGSNKEFREHLEIIRTEAERASSPQDWHFVQASFRGELRDHRDRTLVQLTRIQSEIQAAAEAMQIIAENAAASGDDDKAELAEALSQLDALAEAKDLATVRATIQAVHRVIDVTFERLRQRNQIVLVQLRDEIRLLHKQVEIERNAAFLDPATGIWNRQKLEQHCASLAEKDEPFCLLLVSVHNLKLLEDQHSRDVLGGALKALAQRFAALLGQDRFLGRWNEETFAAVLDLEPAAAIALSREANRRLSGPYSVQETGLAHTVLLKIVTGVLDRPAGTLSSTFREKLVQLSDTLATA